MDDSQPTTHTVTLDDITVTVTTQPDANLSTTIIVTDNTTGQSTTTNH